jgi:hypothetical protein
MRKWIEKLFGIDKVRAEVERGLKNYLVLIKFEQK